MVEDTAEDERSELARVKAELAVAKHNEKVALKEMGSWAREAGLAKGRLEASEMAGVVDDWRERALAAEAEKGELQERIKMYEAAPAPAGELRERVAKIVEAAIERHSPGKSIRRTLDDADAIIAILAAPAPATGEGS